MPGGGCEPFSVVCIGFAAARETATQSLRFGRLKSCLSSGRLTTNGWTNTDKCERNESQMHGCDVLAPPLSAWCRCASACYGLVHPSAALCVNRFQLAPDAETLSRSTLKRGA